MATRSGGLRVEHDGGEEIGVGTVIRTHLWGPEFTGTVVDRKGDTLGVAWHNSFVEGELQVDEVEVWPDAPQHLREWRGGLAYGTPHSQGSNGRSNRCGDRNRTCETCSRRTGGGPGGGRRPAEMRLHWGT